MDRTEISRLGGRARARALSPERRHTIAQLGFAGLVAKRFRGDRQACINWLIAKGLWAQDQGIGLAGGTMLHQAVDPGPMPPADHDPELPF